jgi:methylmalonyl-CoA epimerase
MYKKIDHIAIAVRSLEKAMRTFSETFGITGWSVEEVPEQKTRVALRPLGESRVELLEPMGEGSPVASFLARRGEGIHHVCFQVEDLAEEMRRLKGAGARLVDLEPRVGAGGCLVAFVHPSSAMGVLVELTQPAPYPDGGLSK